MGKTERVGIYTSLIRERIPLNTINYELLKRLSLWRHSQMIIAERDLEVV